MGLLGALAYLAVSFSLLLAVAPAGPPPTPLLRASPPQTLVLQPDGANGTDAFVLDLTPGWNYGDNATLWVGPDAANGSVARAFLWFNTSALPAAATILNATLEVFQYGGAAGAVEVRRASAPWTEGFGDRSWTTVPLTVRETAGLRRTQEPVPITLTLPPYAIGSPPRDLRILLGSTEVPSQANATAFTGGWPTEVRLVFGASLGAGEARDFTLVYSTNGTAVPAYRTRTFDPIPRWTSPAVGTGASGVTVADLDQDGDLEVLYGTSNGLVVALDNTGGTVWAIPVTARSVPYAPQVADLDGDGQLDIVAVTNDPGLVRLNALGAIQWSQPIGLPDLPLSTPTLLDVNGDGVLDALLGGRNSRVDARSGVDGTVILSYSAGDWAYTASVYDVDGDGVGELFFASDDSNVYAYRASGAFLWSNTTTGATFIENSVAIGDVDGDGYADVVTGDDGNSGPEFALNATNGAFTWARDLPAYREGAQTLADLDRDGTLETIVGIKSGPVYALRGADGTILWTNANATGQASAPAVVDLTNDGWPEIIFTDESAVYVLDASGTLLYRWTIAPNDPGFRNLSQQAMDTPVVVDLDGDGTLEVIAATGAGVQAFGTGGLDRDWRTFGYNWNHTHAAGDGTSPDGLPFLEVVLGAPTDHPPAGVTWSSRDGSTSWLAPGGDFGPAEVAAATAPGSWSSWDVTAIVNDTFLGTYPDVGVVLTEADEATGGAHAFHSSDGAAPLLRPRLTIRYTTPSVDPVPRLLATVPNLARPEDSPSWSLSLSGYAADADTPDADLRWNVSGLDPAILQVTGTNVPGGTVLTFYPQPDAWAYMAVTYWVTDPEGNYASQSAWINVTPVNDPPTFTPPATLVVRADVAYAFDFAPYAADVDTPPAGLILSSDDPAHVSVSTFNATFLFPASYLNQWAFVGFLVSDGSSSVGRVVAVKVTSDNPPVLTRFLPDLTMLEGQTLYGVFDLDDYFTDPNNDVLFFSYGYTHLSLTIHANHSVDIEAESDWFGAELVTFRGTDTQGALAEDTIVVTVVPVDDPPVLGPVPDLHVHFDADYPFNLEVYISDPDTPIDGINASTSSPFATVSGRLMTLRYPLALNGTTQPLTIWISDGSTTVSRTIQVTVSDDWPPFVRLKMPDRSLPEDSVFPGAYDLRTHFDDADGTALYYSTGNTSVRVSIDGNGLVELSAEPDFSGTERVTFRGTDPEGALAEDTVWITVLPVNDAPVFSPVPIVHLDSLAGFVDLLPYLSDVDDNVTTLTLSTSSLNATVVGQGILFRYAGDAVEDVEVVVSDGELTARQTVRVVVRLPRETQVLPPWVLWLLGAMGITSLVGFMVYRFHQVEWAFLVTNGGLLVSSVSRRGSAALDTDLMMGMLTAIMDFAKKSFGEETKGDLEGFELGDRRVVITRGKLGFLAAVYRGRTPGSLQRVMGSLLAHIEAHHPDALGDVVDSTNLEDIPYLLKRFVDRAWWPFLRFGQGAGAHAP